MEKLDLILTICETYGIDGGGIGDLLDAQLSTRTKTIESRCCVVAKYFPVWSAYWVWNGFGTENQ